MGPQAILFDLGNVLVDVSHEAIARELARLSRRKPYDDPQAVRRYVFHPRNGLANLFDVGLFSPEEFYRRVQQEFGLQASFADFLRAWTCSIQPRPAAEALIPFLHKQRVTTALLSNTNVSHFEYVLQAFPWIKRVDHFFLSYELKCRKPSTAVYDRVLKTLRIPGDAVLYFDDMLEYVETAQALGIRGVLVDPGTSLVLEIRKALPELEWSQWETP
jgi:HAD superfamily hydrolase (TIGR01509 family)